MAVIHPFARTLQVQAFESHQGWLGLLVATIAVLLVWGGGALTDRAVVYERSVSVQVGEAVRRTTVNSRPRSGAYDVNVVRERRIFAVFPRDAGERLRPGQTAVVRVGADELAGVVTAVDGDADGARAVLHASLREGEPDPFTRGEPVQVAVVVGTDSPIGRLVAGPAAGSEQ